VNYAASMGVGHRLAYLVEDAQEVHVASARAPSFAEFLRKRGALDELHREVGTAFGHPHVVDGHDSGMLQLAADLCFFDEAM
jgi:hypothetical protein